MVESSGEGFDGFGDGFGANAREGTEAWGRVGSGGGGVGVSRVKGMIFIKILERRLNDPEVVEMLRTERSS